MMAASHLLIALLVRQYESDWPAHRGAAWTAVGCALSTSPHTALDNLTSQLQEHLSVYICVWDVVWACGVGAAERGVPAEYAQQGRCAQHGE
jgi:hypothetical protein